MSTTGHSRTFCHRNSDIGNLVFGKQSIDSRYGYLMNVVTVEMEKRCCCV